MPIQIKCDRCGKVAAPKMAMIHHLQLPDGWQARTVHPTDQGASAAAIRAGQATAPMRLMFDVYKDGEMTKVSDTTYPVATQPFDILACSQDCAEALDRADPRDDLGTMAPGD